MMNLEKINPKDQSNYRINEISKIKDYFNEEIQYQQSLTNTLSKYLTIFDILNEILTVFSHINSYQLISLLILRKRRNY